MKALTWIIIAIIVIGGIWWYVAKHNASGTSYGNTTNGQVQGASDFYNSTSTTSTSTDNSGQFNSKG